MISSHDLQVLQWDFQSEYHSLEDTWSTWRSSENPIYLEEDLEYHLKIAPADHLKTWKT